MRDPVLIRQRRIGALVDASVLGARSAPVSRRSEPLLSRHVDRSRIGVWIVRGFRHRHTARRSAGKSCARAYNVDLRGSSTHAAPAAALAWWPHPCVIQPIRAAAIQETLLVLLCVPPLMLWVFLRSERRRRLDRQRLRGQSGTARTLGLGKFSDSGPGNTCTRCVRVSRRVVGVCSATCVSMSNWRYARGESLMMREHDIEFRSTMKPKASCRRCGTWSVPSAGRPCVHCSR